MSAPVSLREGPVKARTGTSSICPWTSGWMSALGTGDHASTMATVKARAVTIDVNALR